MSETERDERQMSAPEPEAHREAPRRVSALGIAIALLVVALFVFLHLSGAVGPGAH
jgi:hypothetical protein